MKTSNKILLGLFLLGVLTVIGIHVALYAKYKAGDFASKEEIKGVTYYEQELPPSLKAVSITGLDDCNVKTAGKAILKYNKESNVRLTVSIKNDTLYLAANDWARTEDYEKGTRNNQTVSLTLPGNLPIKLQYASLALTGTANSAYAPSYNIELGTQAELGIVRREPQQTPACFNKIQVVSNLSTVMLDGHTVINELTVKATNSYLDYKKAIIKQLNMDVDEKTSIIVSKNSLNNINLTPKQ